MVEIRTSWMMELAALTSIIVQAYEHQGFCMFSVKQVQEMERQQAELSKRLFGEPH